MRNDRPPPKVGGLHPAEPNPGTAAVETPAPLSFVVCVSDYAVLEAHLLTSPCLGPGSPHEVIAVCKSPNAALGLNHGLERAKHGLVVCVHQDVTLPPGWDRRAVEQYRLAEEWFGPIGVTGVYGVGDVVTAPAEPPAVLRIGRVVDRDRLLDDGPERPARVVTLDELLLIVPRESPLRFDPELGFHLYGADLCLQARERGLAAVAIEATCRHHSCTAELPEAFFASARVFARKWAALMPLATPCVLFDGKGRMFGLGNAEPGDRSGLARATGEAMRASAHQGGEAPSWWAVPTLREATAAERSAGGRGTGPRIEGGLTSVIVPCWNQVELTRDCLRALFRHTRRPWELIVVDNGSTDGTGEFLAGVQIGGRVPVTVIHNARNLGFPAAINQGLRAARGEFLVLLNNDAVVTEAWLDHLIALTRAAVVSESVDDAEGHAPADQDTKIPPEGGTPAETCSTRPRGTAFQAVDIDHGQDARATIGLVGPMSNYASPPQLVEGVPYRDMDEMHEFAGRWRAEHRGKWFTVGKLSGFCLLMTRAAYDAVGELDEQFGLGFFDDDDLAERARRAGFSLAVAHDLFIHHFGSRTFIGSGIDAGRLIDENAWKFFEKWGQDVPQGRRVALSPWGARTERTEEDSRSLIPDSKGTESKEEEAVSRIGPKPAKRSPGPDGSAEAGADGTGPPALRYCAPSRLREKTSSVPAIHLGECSSRGRARVSLTMIVRDEEKNLPHCLESVRGVFDEIVVVDTGSVDRTPEIARKYGARVFDFVWVDDFAAARNAALARVAGDYAFWLDADDVIEPPEREKLIALLEGLGSGDLRSGVWAGSGDPRPTSGGGPRLTGGGDAGEGPAAYVVKCACDPGEDGSGGETVVDHIRLFPVGETIRWTYRVHEQILPALRRAGIPVRWTDLTVRHTGYSDRALRARKLVRDARILRDELEERPDDPFVLFNLGAIAIERQEWREALGLLRRSLAGSAPTDSITRKLFALIARAHQMLGEPREALSACAAGLEHDPDDAELIFRGAVVRRQTGDVEGARRCWERILTLRRPEQFASVDQGIYGHLTRRNLAGLAAERGDHNEAARLWRAVLAECPGDREATAKLRQPAAAEVPR